MHQPHALVFTLRLLAAARFLLEGSCQAGLHRHASQCIAFNCNVGGAYS
jgi:hypothetical protein